MEPSTQPPGDGKLAWVEDCEGTGRLPGSVGCPEDQGRLRKTTQGDSSQLQTHPVFFSSWSLGSKTYKAIEANVIDSQGWPVFTMQESSLCNPVLLPVAGMFSPNLFPEGFI